MASEAADIGLGFVLAGLRKNPQNSGQSPAREMLACERHRTKIIRGLGLGLACAFATCEGADAIIEDALGDGDALIRTADVKLLAQRASARGTTTLQKTLTWPSRTSRTTFADVPSCPLVSCYQTIQNSAFASFNSYRNRTTRTRGMARLWRSVSPALVPVMSTRRNYWNR